MRLADTIEPRRCPHFSAPDDCLVCAWQEAGRRDRMVAWVLHGALAVVLIALLAIWGAR